MLKLQFHFRKHLSKCHQKKREIIFPLHVTTPVKFTHYFENTNEQNRTN